MSSFRGESSMCNPNATTVNDMAPISTTASATSVTIHVSTDYGYGNYLRNHMDLFSSSLELAIQSLDSLNDQIVQFIFSPKACDYDADADIDDDCNINPKQREALKSSMALMRRLLLDAQSKFRKMVEDNKQLASRIDGDIQSVQEEVTVLHAEIADTNRRINELSTSAVLTPSPTPPSSGGDNNSPSRCPRCLSCSHREGDNQLVDELSQLKSETDKLSQQNRSLQREVEELRRLKDQNEQLPQTEQLQRELHMAKEALTALKADRKRLKEEKFDLLNQMKQLYGTLEDKERELRDFIRNYEQRMKESDESLRQLALERDETEREKWSILKHARDESERSVTLCAQLGLKETQLKQVQQELAEARKQLSSLGYYSDQESVTSSQKITPVAAPSGATNGFHTPSVATTPVNGAANMENGAMGAITPVDVTTPVISDAVDSEGSPVYAGRAMSVCNDSSSPPPSMMLQGLSRSAEELTHMLSTLELNKHKHNKHNRSNRSTSSGHRSKSGSGTWGSISRVFSRSRSRRSVDGGALFEEESNGVNSKRTSWSPYTSLCASPLQEESYTEKIRLLEEAQGIPMDRWRANVVLAWLELSLGMPQYSSLCAENIKSGKILLELNDNELEAGLGISNPMHRRKLRLAIEELRDPSSCIFPKIGELTHAWVCGEWLPSLGLGQYIDSFATHLVDGRVLEQIGRKELEKFLGISRKFHQASVLHAIQLLRMVNYDKQALSDRRAQCDVCDADPIVWTNQRFIKWARSIDLGEYADNLKDSGVHGSLVVLEPSFSADTMATALGIPQSKNIIRRHLTTELDALVQPARLSLEQEIKANKRDSKGMMGSVGRNFSRSYAGGLHVAKSSDSRRSSLRGSLSRALGLTVKKEMNNSSSLPPPSPRSPQHSTTNATRSTMNHTPKYATLSSVDTHRRVKSSGDIDIVTVTPV